MAAVIIGGGVIGLSIAYYISIAQPGRIIYLVDSESSLLLSASGHSGGFIPSDWFSPDVLSLASLSFRLHRDLAEAHNGRNVWGYTQSTAFSLVSQVAENGEKVRGEDWLLHGTSRASVARQYTIAGKMNSFVQRDALINEDGSPKWFKAQAESDLERISGNSGCAQIEPKEFCRFLLKECEERGTRILLNSKPTSLKRGEDGRIRAIQIVTQVLGETSRKFFELGCKDIIIAAGCWTPSVFQSLLHCEMKIKIKPLAGYSVVVRSAKYNQPITYIADDGMEVEMAHSIFCPPGSSWTYSPEAMARLGEDGRPEIYVAGLNSDQIPLPELAGNARELMKHEDMANLKRTATAIVDNLNLHGLEPPNLEIVRESLCFRPVSSTGNPIISKVNGTDTNEGGSIYVASGHGPWGITLSLGTGFVISEMLQEKEPSANIFGMSLSQHVVGSTSVL